MSDLHMRYTPDWYERAACKGRRSSLFFAEQGSRKKARLAAERIAKRICARCPVRKDCLISALSNEKIPMPLDDTRTLYYDTWGIWGGTNRRERDATRHLKRCKDRFCRGCRSMRERVRLLESGFQRQVKAWFLLAEGEKVA
ncbi:MAG TPA: WhiB family transcriptional regulator [Dehalococcoidia bacterium]|nr:WhiB family transcriptional regulator [Dehalococcoidia bacterium]